MSDPTTTTATATLPRTLSPGDDIAVPASVLIVCWNGLEHLRSCLPTVLSQDYPNFEVLLLDNASSDGSPEWVEQTYGDRVRLIRTGANLGYVGANNLGFTLATGEVLVVLTPDTQVAPGWLRGLVEAVTGDPTVGLATAKVCHFDRRDIINTCGNDIHMTGMAFCRHLDEPSASFNAPEDVSGVSGCSFALRRSLWQRIGGFDDLFFMYMEDTDLSLRVRLAGFRIVATPAATVYHKYDINMRPAKYFWMERNRLVLLLKNYRAGTLALLTPALLLTEAMVWGFAALRAEG
ncbi:MAG: glycosyltransferase family 2 protein [Chloroflexi bacterium]|nr:glycosyltransferase family 2 protein [Chloroflexota bacterium]